MFDGLILYQISLRITLNLSSLALQTPVFFIFRVVGDVQASGQCGIVITLGITDGITISLKDGTVRTPVFHLQKILDAFERQKVLTKQDILKAAGCSTMTAWRLLSRHGYYTSYNDNARHYTLSDIPKFDKHGLWSYRHVRFSKWGSLTNTVVGLVEESPGGMTANDLERLLDKNVKPILRGLIERGALTREASGARFVYFSSQGAAQQRTQREKQSKIAKATRSLPPLEQIVALLVEIIQRPRNTPREWARRLTRQGVRLSTDDIQAVLDHYQIDAKKGLLKS